MSYFQITNDNSLTGGPMPSTLNELSSSSNDENNEGIP